MFFTVFGCNGIKSPPGEYVTLCLLKILILTHDQRHGIFVRNAKIKLKIVQCKADCKRKHFLFQGLIVLSNTFLLFTKDVCLTACADSSLSRLKLINIILLPKNSFKRFISVESMRCVPLFLFQDWSQPSCLVYLSHIIYQTTALKQKPL